MSAGVVLMMTLGATPMIEAKPSRSKANATSDSLLAATENAARAERLEALGKLVRMKGATGSARIAAKLEGLSPTDVEAALRLEVLGDAKDRSAATTKVASWVLTSSTTLVVPTAEPEMWRRSLVAATKVLAGGKKDARDPTPDQALVALAKLDHLEVAKAALAAADKRESFEAPPYLDLFTELLGRPELAFDPHLLSLMAKTKNARALEPILRSLAAFADANPRQPAPDHAKALRSLTGQKLGDDPGEWRAWDEKRRSRPRANPRPAPDKK